jgi:hypothetical protein
MFFDSGKVDTLKAMFKIECEKTLLPLLELLGFCGEKPIELPSL